MQQIGKYQLVRKIATGGMAEVFLAKAAGPMGFEKTLVLKRILPHLAEDEQFIQMFLGEAKLAAQLNHPNVVQIFDFGEAEGAYFIAMEFIDGPNLRGLSKRSIELGRALPLPLCAKTISFAAEGLAYAHDFVDPATGEPMGLIHRDISPDNILLGRTGGVKVVDFGIAKAAGQAHHTKTGTLKGKLAYMPPEQLHQKQLDRRADVFSLGMVLYELVTGQKPFDVSTEVAIMQAILFEPLIPANARRPDVPPMLQSIIDRALAKDRDQRYASCRDFQVDLERFILTTGEPVGAYQLAALVNELGAPGAAPLGTPPQGSGPKSRPGTNPAGAQSARASAAPVAQVQPPASPPPARAAPAVAVAARTAPKEDEVEVDLRTNIAPATAVPAPEEPVPLTQPRAARASRANVAVPAPPPPPGPQTQVTTPAAIATEEVAARASRVPLFAAAVGLLLIAGGGGYFALRSPSVGVPAPRAPTVAEPVAVKVNPPAPVAKAEPPAEVVVPTPAPTTPPPAAVAAIEAPAAVPAVAVVTPEPTPEPVKEKQPERAPANRREKEKKVIPVVAVRDNSPARTEQTAAPKGAALASFRVETSPPAQVKVNGKFIGVSPAVVTGVEPGEVDVEVYDSRLGFRKRESFSVSAGDNGTKKVVVASGTLEFRIRPYATVMLDEKSLGQTPFDGVTVYEGKHTVRLINRDLNKDVTVTYDVKPGANVFKYNLSE